jgi:hypothetical protein
MNRLFFIDVTTAEVFVKTREMTALHNRILLPLCKGNIFDWLNLFAQRLVAIK